MEFLKSNLEIIYVSENTETPFRRNLIFFSFALSAAQMNMYLSWQGLSHVVGIPAVD